MIQFTVALILKRKPFSDLVGKAYTFKFVDETTTSQVKNSMIHLHPISHQF